uniref:COR domain-containing protein n=1 Tax=Amphimedon queenslandica TaxID=400682 RepID=A0A1X7T2Y0_AMPQE
MYCICMLTADNISESFDIILIFIYKYMHVYVHVSIGAYERALKEQGSADVAYARLMLLGSAGTGKTSLKHSLMEEPFKRRTTSTIVSDVSSVRPFGHKWQTMRENKWREATEKDELEEIAHLFNSRSSSDHASVLSAQYSHDESNALVSTGSIASDLNVEIRIKSIFERASSTDQKTELLVQPFLHIWDCGGQPVFLEILPAFLTPRTMFLLLFDASKDFRERWQSHQNTPDGKVLFGEVVNESTSDLMIKWMSTIHSYLVKHNKDDTSSPSLYCIGTRGDKLKRKKKKEQAKKQIQSLYEEKEFSDLIKDVLIIDNTTSGKGVKEDPSITDLRGAIDSFINRLAVKTPVNWVLFRKVLQELKLNVISVSDTIAIGAACHISAADVPEVLKFYHELGAVLYYPQIEGLKNKVILSPKWFVDTIGKVFALEKGWSGTNRWYLLRNNGILVQPLYQEVWQSSGIDPEKIIELLVHFRLAAQVQTELYDSRFKQYFLPAVLQGYTGDPNEVLPGYKLRASPIHITFSTSHGYVPPGFFTRLATTVATDDNVKLNFDDVYAAPATGFIDRLATAVNLCSKVETKSIYRNRVCFSYGRPSDDLFLTDINDAIQFDVLRYVPEDLHPVPFEIVCQEILKLLNDCCQKVEETLILYHDRSSRKVQYVCQCRRSKEVHYIKDIDAEKQTCSDPVHCKMERRPRSLTINESLWFKEKAKHLPQEKQLQLETSLRLVDLEEDNDDDNDDDDTKNKPATNYSPTQISESNDDQQKDIIFENLTLLSSDLERDIKGDGGVKCNNNKDKGTKTNTLNESQEHGSTSIEEGQSITSSSFTIRLCLVVLDKRVTLTIDS